METSELPAWRRTAGAAVPWLLATLLACLVLQVFLAGAGLLADSQYLGAHKAFAHVIEAIAVAVAACAFIGGDKQGGWAAVALLFLMSVQYGLIQSTEGLLRALHPVNALAIFGLTLGLLLHRPAWPARPTPHPAATAAKPPAHHAPVVNIVRPQSPVVPPRSPQVIQRKQPP